jgi:hypothetical protein
MKKLYMEGLNSFFFLEKERFQTDSTPSAQNELIFDVWGQSPLVPII